jgi:hypothetical protein
MGGVLICHTSWSMNESEWKLALQNLYFLWDMQRVKRCSYECQIVLRHRYTAMACYFGYTYPSFLTSPPGQSSEFFLAL